MSQQPDDAAADHVWRLRKHRGLALDDLVSSLAEALETVGQIRTLGAEIDHAFGVAGVAPTLEPNLISIRNDAAPLLRTVFAWLEAQRDEADRAERAAWQHQIHNLGQAMAILRLPLTEE